MAERVTVLNVGPSVIAERASVMAAHGRQERSAVRMAIRIQAFAEALVKSKEACNAHGVRGYAYRTDQDIPEDPRDFDWTDGMED